MRTLRMLMALALLGGLCLAGALPALAEDADLDHQDQPTKLDDIHVKGQGLHRDDLATTVNIVPAETFEEKHYNRIEEVLQDVPGVEIGNYSQAGVANLIQMRGFTSGGHGGDVAVFVDGIPLNEGESHADGYADINVLVPLEMEKLEVYKGPSSALFGNFGRGGALAFYTKNTGDYNKLRMDYGSFGTVDAQGAFGHKMTGALQNNTAFQVYHTDGWQDHSDWTRMTASTRFKYDVSDKMDVSLSFRAHQADWDSPGYIPKSQFDDTDASRHQAVNAQDDGGHKKFFTERLDTGYSISKDLRALYWAYATQQDFTRFAKFGYTAGGQTENHNDRSVVGTGTSLNLDTKVANRSLTGVVGAEVYDEVTDLDIWNTNNRVRQNKTESRIFQITTYSLFTQGEYEVSRYFRPMVGLRYDTFGGHYDNNDPGSASYSNDMNKFEEFSPKVGFRSMIFDKLDFRASYCEGFALPSAEAKFDPKIQVDAMNIKQYEAGLTYSIPKRLWADVAYFILDTDHEIQEDPPGSGEYHNVGKTRRQGVETGVKVFPMPGLEIFGDITFFKSEVKESADSSLVGKDVATVPDYLANLGAQYTAANGLGGRLKWHFVGSYYVDDQNTSTYDGYKVMDASLFYLIPSHDGRQYKVTLAVDNVFDEHYSQAVWSGYGTTNYSVSWPRTLWLGVSLDW